MGGRLRHIFFPWGLALLFLVSWQMRPETNDHPKAVQPFQAAMTSRAAGNAVVRSTSGYFHLGGRAQGTTYAISYGFNREVLTQVSLDSIFREIDQSLSIYDSNSLVSRFNRSREGIVADSHLLRMVRLSKAFSNRSDGAFDITLKTVSALWGFGPGARTVAPTEADIKKAMKHTGMHLLGITGNYIRKKDPVLQIDCNGIAQGYTVDIIADYLERRGVRDYLVELGGEIRLSGVNAEGSPWTIGIESPPEGNRPFELARTIRPGSGAITSSGIYRNQHQAGGRQVSHLIDPGTGFPIRNGMVSVTVWAKDATTADAIDNVLMVIGPAEIRHFLDAYPGVEAYWQFRLPDGRLVYAASPGFIRMMDQAGTFPAP